ncbi:hypothetical protein [Profundibacter sp.]
MINRILTLSLGIGTILLSTQHAFGQGQNCAAHDAVVTRLATAYGETRHSIGLAADNSVVEVFASDETGTWTITVTTADGTTCLVASGQAFEDMAAALPPATGNDT